MARAFLPLVDEGAKNGESRFVELLGWKDDETVLARVVPEDGSSENWYVVARHWPSGRLEHLTGGDAYARLSDVVPALVE